MMGFGLIGFLLVIGIVAYLIGWRPDFLVSHRTTRQPQKDALDILKERYAQGDISREDYEEMRRDIES